MNNGSGALRKWQHDPLVWVIILSAVLALLGVFDMARNLGRPYGGYISYRRADVPVGEVDANTPIWWPGLRGNRLDPGDTLVTVDTLPYHPNARQVFAAAAEAQRAFVRVEFIPHGQDTVIARSVPVLRFDLADFIDVRLPDLIMAMAFWLLAIVVYRSRPDDPVNRAFALLAAIVAMIRALYVHSVFLDDLLSTLVELILLTAVPMVGISLIYFASQFPEPTGGRWRWLLWVAVGLGFVTALFAVLARIPGLPSPPWPSSAWFGRMTYLGTQILYLCGLGLLATRLIAPLVSRKPIGRRRRRVLLIVLAGFLIAAPMLLGSAFTGATVGGVRVGYFWSGLDIRYLSLAVPVAFAYVLVRYQAMRSPSHLFVAVIALASSALIAALGVWAWTKLHPLWLQHGERPPLLAFFLVAMIASTIWGTQASWRGTFGSYFHRERRNFGASVAFGREVARESDLRRLPSAIAHSLVQRLELERAAVWLLNAGDGRLQLVAQSGRFDAAPPNVLAAPPALPDPKPVHVTHRADVPPWLRVLGDTAEFELAVPLLSGSSLIGLLGLGPRWDEEVFDDRDLMIAELVGQQASLFLVAAQNVAELRQVPARLSEIQERERTRLARELHDTVQQFLGRLPFYLAVGRDAIGTRPELTSAILEDAIADVEDAAVSLRQIRYDLAPSQLERGLVQPIAALADHFQSRFGVATTVNASPDVDEHTALSTRHAVFRVVQQALDNVASHAGASAVVITLGTEPGAVVFSVADDGCGASLQKREEAHRRGSFGLESMRARLEACGGEFQLQATPGAGTTISGRVPSTPSNGHTPAT